MDFLELFEKRKSVRKFREKTIDKTVFKKLIESINSAPSAGNLQAYEIVAVKEKATKEKLAEAAWGQEFIAQAPLVLVFFANPARSSRKYGERGANLYCIQDATIAAVYAQLAAAALGLASVWVGAFEEEDVKKILKAPEQLRPVAIIPIGYAAENPDRHERRKQSDLVSREHF
jgi:nitroreductase